MGVGLVVEVEVVAEGLDHLLSALPKLPSFPMLIPPLTGGTQILLHNIALQHDILVHTITQAKVCTMVQQQPHMDPHMECPMLKALLLFHHNTTPSRGTTWLLAGSEAVVHMVARPAMVHMITQMLLHHPTNLLHIHSS